MQPKAKLIGSVLLVAVLLLSVGGVSAERSAASQALLAPVGVGFTYQGLLKNASGQPVTGACDFQFTLWDALDAGAQIGITNTVLSVGITQGYFTAQVNAGGEFGASAFTGQARWLAIAVRCPAGNGGYADLAPRQALTAAPYALYATQANTAVSATTALAAPWAGLTGLPAGFADGTDNDTTYTAGAGLDLSADQFSVVTGTIQQRVSGTCAMGRSIRAITATGAVICEVDDDTLYTSGYGLSLAGNQFSVITEVLTVPTATLALSATQTAWGNLTGVPAGFADGTDNNTLYTAGAGLNLAANQFSVDTSTIQQQVSGICAVGSTIRAINADGTVVCQADAPLNRAMAPSANTTITVDSGGDVGIYASITLGVDGLPVASYYDYTNSDLKVLHCGNTTCSSGNISTTVDSAGSVGYYTSIALGADGLPVISYYDESNTSLKVLHCGNAACSSGNISTTVASAGIVGEFTSITLGADGLPVISYSDDSNTSLKVLHCGNAACSSGNASTTVDSGGDVGRYTSITLGADGLPVVSYYDYANYDLKVLHCGNSACSSGNISTTVDSGGGVGAFTSITLGADGLPVVSYQDSTNSDLKVLHCGNAACSSGNTSTAVDSGGDVGRYTSITLGADGLPVVSYYDYTNSDLKVLHCGDPTCSSGNTATTVDSGGDVGILPAITLGVDGLPVVSYRDTTNASLKVLHCSNVFCVPYFRRR